MRTTQISSLLSAVVLSMSSTPVNAAVNDYVLTLPNQNGAFLGTPFTGETVVCTVRADTATLTSYPVLAIWPAAEP